MIEVPFSDRKQVGQLQKRLRESYERIGQLEKALGEAAARAHDFGRMLSPGKLHQTATFDTCEAMACEDITALLKATDLNSAKQEGK